MPSSERINRKAPTTPPAQSVAPVVRPPLAVPEALARPEGGTRDEATVAEPGAPDTAPRSGHDFSQLAIAPPLSRFASAPPEPPVLPTATARVLQRDPDPNAPPPPAPAPLSGTAGASSTTITVVNTTRSLSAKTLSDLWTALTSPGNREAASVLPAFKPEPQYEYDADDKVTKAVLNVTETREMPVWVEKDSQCPPIQAEWTRFYGVLDQHENNHLAIDRQHFANLHLKLIGKKREAAWKVVDDTIDAANTANEAYDTRTNHGISEGSTINAWVQCAPEKVGSGTAELPDTGAASAVTPPSAADAGIAAFPANLAVSQPHDPSEYEAERVADEVMRMPSPAPVGISRTPGGLGRKCAVCEATERLLGRKCAACEEEDRRLGRSATQVARAADPLASTDVGSVVSDGLTGGGKPLDEGTRAFMEPRFGHDFSQVRVHTDARAADSAVSLQAHAYAVGSDIAFAPGQYNPGTSQGNHLLAHELTHVVQQGGATGGIVENRVPRAVLHRKSAIDSAIEDPAKIEDLPTATLQLATPDQKIALIRKILETGKATHRLQLLWDMKEPVIEANIILWRSTWDKYAAVMDNHPLKSQFTRDVADAANAMLTESTALCEAYLKQYGLSTDAQKAGINTPERDKSINAVQQKAIEVMGAQTQLKQLYEIKIQTDQKYLGVRSSVSGSYPFELDVQPMYASPKGREVWEKTNAAVKELTASIDSYLEAFPELYPLVMGGTSSKRDAYTDPSKTSLAATKPLEAIEKSMRQTIDNIKATKGPMVETLARDRKLGPVEQQLLSGARTAPGAESRNWKTGPIWSTMVPTITAKAGFVTPEGVMMLALQIALAATTGGIGNLLMSGAQAALSHAEAGVLQTASDTSLSAKTAIVGKEEVAMARLTAAVDAAFLVFDLVPGVKQARGSWSAARQGAHATESAAAALEKKALQFEQRMMEKAEKPELDGLLKSMQQDASAAKQGLQKSKAAAARATGAEKTLAEAEVRQAETALARGQASMNAAKAVGKGEALVAELGGRRFSWVKGRGMVICASPCADAVTWLETMGLDLVAKTRAQSPMAADLLENRIASAKKHLADLDQLLSTAAPDKTAFDRAAVHANSIIDEVHAQQRFALLRFPASVGGKVATLGNKEWAEAVLAELRLRKKAIEDVDKAFYGSLTDPGVKNNALAAHAGEWEGKLGKFPEERTKPKQALGGEIQNIEKHGNSPTVDLNERSRFMESTDKALNNYERELRGQRELVMSGAELKAFTDKEAGNLLFPGVSTSKKPDYIAELPTKIIIGDSKGAGDVKKSIDQIKPALDSLYVKNAIANGKAVECRVYLDFTEATKNQYRGVGHPPVLHELIDGAYKAVMVTDKLPLYVFFN